MPHDPNALYSQLVDGFAVGERLGQRGKLPLDQQDIQRRAAFSFLRASPHNSRLESTARRGPTNTSQTPWANWTGLMGIASLALWKRGLLAVSFMLAELRNCYTGKYFRKDIPRESFPGCKERR